VLHILSASLLKLPSVGAWVRRKQKLLPCPLLKQGVRNEKDKEKEKEKEEEKEK